MEDPDRRSGGDIGGWIGDQFDRERDAAQRRNRHRAIANGVIDGKLKAKDYGIEFKTKGDVRVLDATLTYPAGTNSGWHEHPGVVIATVISGRSNAPWDVDPPRHSIPTNPSSRWDRIM